MIDRYTFPIRQDAIAKSNHVIVDADSGIAQKQIEEQTTSSIQHYIHVYQARQAEFTSELLQDFILRNPERIRKYLALYPFLRTELRQAKTYIREIFPSEQLELKVVIDPEIPDLTTLYIFVWTDANVDVALGQLHQLEDNWYLELPFFVRQRLSVNVKFK